MYDLTLIGAHAFAIGTIITILANIYYIGLFHMSLPFRQWGLIGWANVVGLVLVAVGMGVVAVTVKL
jgi:hypothetical protein